MLRPILPRPLSIVVPAAVAAIVVAAASGPVSAQQPSTFTGEVVVTATGSEEDPAEVPAAVTVIDREEIADAQADTVVDLLRRVPGMTVARSGPEGSVTSLFSRGTDSDHTLVMFDGVRLNSPYFGGFDWSLAPTSGLERVEVVRGPYSALWGSDALGGVVNLIPRRAGDDDWTAAITGEAGDDDWRRLEAAAGWAGAGFDLYASGLDREGSSGQANSDFATRQGLVDAGFSWGERGSRIAVLHQDLTSEVGIPFADPLTPSPHRRQWSDQRLTALPLRWAASDSWHLEVTAAEVERDFRFADPDDASGFTASETAADTTQARVASRHELGRHQLTWGGEWREDEVDDGSVFGPNLTAATSQVTSTFVQDVWRPADRLRVIVGARWDDTDTWGDRLSPRANLSALLAEGLELRVGYGEGFRQPSVGELYFPFSGNPQLEPETSRSWEVGLDSEPGGGLGRWQLTWFEIDVEQLIEYDYASFAFRNIGVAAITGAELGWQTPVGSDAASRLQATWLDTEDDAGLPLLRRPEWSGSWSMSGLLWHDVRGDLTVLYVGARDDVDPVSYERTRIGSHTTGHLAAAWEVGRDLELTLRVLNVTDERYQEIAGYPAPGRRFLGGLRWRR